MNKSQRQIVISKLTSVAKAKKKEISQSLAPRPEIADYLKEHFDTNKYTDFQELIKKSLESASYEYCRDFEGNLIYELGRSGANIKERQTVRFNIFDLIEPPSKYNEDIADWEEEYAKAKEAILEIDKKVEQLSFRIQLASNAVMDKFVQDVDNLGDITVAEVFFKESQ